MDTKSGLWFHGWTFEGNHNFAEALWARVISWITIVFRNFIEAIGLAEKRSDSPLLTNLWAGTSSEALSELQTLRWPVAITPVG